MPNTKILIKFAKSTMSQDNAPQQADNSPGRWQRSYRWLRRFMALPTIAAVAVVVYIIFFGEKSVSERIAYQRVIDSLEICLRQQQDSLLYYRDLNRRLHTDPALMEQVVREQYNMKRQNEDIYVVE